ncbi:Splicing factor 3b, subunit 4 [Handroanthus impetiginosus]|uniref:Splicing factor 3b, subunit 4 n=1 Tax=Handroanthus impetiginosus TaxID=429701 RepID=A0A2G9GNB5_9LAMI|nr:Splicing factor 3b, subunit 4 [Handroanthus impetiginosus]
MAKKHKNPLKNGSSGNVLKSNEGNSSTVFKTLFGEIPEHNLASNSLFSYNNPFRRKVIETRESNHELGLGHAEKNANYEGNFGDSHFPEMRQQEKRKKDEEEEESSDFDTKSVAGKSKKLKAVELKDNEMNDNGNIGSESKETLEKRTDVSHENEKKKKKKRKRDELEAEYEARRYGFKDETEETKGETSLLGEKRKKMDNPEDMMVSKEGFDDENKLLRTIFVGNLPLKLKKKEIAQEFAKFGEVESVRIRSVPIIDGKIPRKGAVIKKQINENGDSVHAYIVFKSEESAQASLAHNMAVVGGNHIRVDRACPPRKKLKGDDSPLYDNKRTVFVGNLPFDVKDEEIYKLFTGIKNLETSVEAVRVIRDPGSSLGKGIAYVLFKTTDAANLVLKKHNLKIRDRELRLSHAKSNNTPSKRKNSSQPEITNTPAKKFSVASRTPDSGNKVRAKANVSYQGIRASKSGSQKKVHKKITTTTKSVSQAATTEKLRTKKRPAVAARKEKARKAANTTQVAGTKRKLGNRTPETGGQKKKARKFR